MRLSDSATEKLQRAATARAARLQASSELEKAHQLLTEVTGKYESVLIEEADSAWAALAEVCEEFGVDITGVEQ